MMDVSKPPTRLVILGTGTFAQEVADLASDVPDFEVVGFAASTPPYEPGSTLLGLPIYWVDELSHFADRHRALCALVTTERWRFIQQARELGMHFATLVHPTARISRLATIGEGSIISAGVVISTQTQIGNHVIVNRGALIGHHDKIHDLVTVGPGANLAGNVTVGKCAWIGIGAIVLEKRTIGEHSIIGARAVVTHDVPARVEVMGVPARIVKENVEGL